MIVYDMFLVNYFLGCSLLLKETRTKDADHFCCVSLDVQEAINARILFVGILF